MWRSPIAERALTTRTTASATYAIALTCPLIARGRALHSSGRVTVAVGTALAALDVPVVFGALVTQLADHIWQAFAMTKLVVTTIGRAKVRAIHITIAFFK